MTTHMSSRKRSYSQNCIVFHRLDLLPFLEIVKGGMAEVFMKFTFSPFAVNILETFLV